MSRLALVRGIGWGEMSAELRGSEVRETFLDSSDENEDAVTFEYTILVARILHLVALLVVPGGVVD